MALKGVVESLEGLEESVAGLYAKSEDGKFRLDIEGGFKTSSEVEGLTSALGKERQAAAEAQRALKAFEGIEPKVARDALQKVETWGEDSKKAAEKLEAELQQRLQPVTAERDRFKTLAEERGAQIDNFTIDAALRGSKAFGKVEDPIYRESLMGKVRSSLKMQDGKLVGFKADGMQVFDGNGNPATGEDLISGIVNSIPDVQKYFTGASATGSGANPAGGSFRTGTPNPWKSETRNITEQNELYRKDPATARSLAKEAGVVLP